jgi:hypothetical protein
MKEVERLADMEECMNNKHHTGWDDNEYDQIVFLCYDCNKYFIWDGITK